MPSPNIKCSWVPSNHVLDMDVQDPRPPTPSAEGRDVTFVRAVDVPEVDRELEEWVANSFIEPGELCRACR